jgi:sugar/nucleoside kinase (ribokinase family)
MRLDVAVVGAPFLDLTFEGLPRVPCIGEELIARALHVAPGGTGMQALGTARLGLATALIAPIPHQGGGVLLRSFLVSEGVEVVGRGPSPPGTADLTRDAVRVPVTALLSTQQGVAMATVLSGEEPSEEDVAIVRARAIVLSLGRVPMAPSGAALYVVTGGLELSRADQTIVQRLASARALVLNAAEATVLTGRHDPEDAACVLARHVPTAVVTMGSDGAVAAEGDTLTRVAAPRVDSVDATGAGDLFVSAYVWADLAGEPVRNRLEWASLYAALSVRAPTAFAGAVGLERLVVEGSARGLVAPGVVVKPMSGP